MASTVEPDTAPPADTYFPLVLGPTILEPGSTRYYSLRYEFKPASIDTGSPGTLHKGAENKVTVEWSNNQAGKPKVAFQGNSEDAKDFDAVIFFDGTSFRLERLHRAVKSLRHLRQGETAAALAGSGGGGGSGAVSPIHSNGGHAEKNQYKAHHITETITDEAPVAPKPEAAPAPAPAPAKKPTKRKGTSSKAAANKKQPPVGVVKEASPELEIDEFEMMAEPEPDIEPEPEPKRAKPSTPVTAPAAAAAAPPPPVEEVDILGEDDVEVEEIVEVLEEHSDYEIEDVDVSEDEEAEKAGGANDPAATLRAQAAAEAAGNKSSSESGSSSSDSGSGSSSSESGSDDEDSASSGDDI